MSAALAENRCPACAAPRVRGDGACAECGAAAPRTVAGDVPCRRCGYSLKGLEVSGVCPECGSAVRLSLMGDFLAASSPAHVARLARGAILVEVALYMGVLMLCVGTPLTIAVMPWSSDVVKGIAGAANLGLTLLGIVGWWMVSAPDPGLGRDSPGERSRVMLRVCLAISGAANVATLGGVMSSLLDVSPALYVGLVRGGTGIVAVAWVVKYFAGVSYVRVLAARIPSTGLAETARTTLLMPVWTFGLGVPLFVGTVALGYAAPPAGLLAIVIASGMGIAVLVWFIWYCSMVTGLRDRLETVRAMMPRVAAD